MNKKSLAMTVAGLFAAAATSVAAANITESVRSAKTTPEDKFESAGQMSQPFCSTENKGLTVSVQVKASAQDYEALVKSALPAAMLEMTDEQKDAYIKTLPHEQAMAIVQAYQEKVGGFMQAINEGTNAALNSTFGPAVNDKSQLDAAKAAALFKSEFQLAADGIEATGVSVSYELSITDNPAGDAKCRLFNRGPAPQQP